VQALFPLSGEQYQLQLTLSREAKEKLERARDLMSHTNPTADLAVVVERALDVLLEGLGRRRFAQTKSGNGIEVARRVPKTDTRSAKGRLRGEGAEPPSAEEVSAKRRLLHEGTVETTESPSAEEASATGRLCGEGAEPPPTLRHVSERIHRRALPRAVVREVVERDGAQCTFIGSDGQRCAARSLLQFHHDKPWALKGADTVDNVRLLCRAHNLLVTERELGSEVVAAKVAARRGESAA
jgi:hypothetical protein